MGNNRIKLVKLLNDRSLTILSKMEQYFSKTHLMTKIVSKYKEQTKMKELPFEDLVELLKGKKVLVSLKIDGELTGVEFAGQSTRLFSKDGRVRESLPVTDEITAICKRRKIKYIQLVGELYVVNEKGNIVPYPKAVSVLRAPKSEDAEKQIRFAVFDLLKLNQLEYKHKDYKERIRKIKDLFGNGKYVHPIIIEEGNLNTVEQMWDKVTSGKEGYEGLVIRYNSTVIKVKPLLTVDAAVIGVDRSESDPSMMGALLLALLDKNNIFRTIGRVGTGFKIEDRKKWLQWALKNKVSEEKGTIFVNPYKDSRVVQVTYEQPNFRETNAYKYKNEWQVVGKLPSATLRKPRFDRIRDDKKVNSSDCRLEQIPNLTGGEKMQKSSWLKCANEQIQMFDRVIEINTNIEGTVVGIKIEELNNVQIPKYIVAWDEPINGLKVFEISPNDIEKIENEEMEKQAKLTDRDKEIVQRDVELEQSAIDEYEGQLPDASPELQKVLKHLIDEEEGHRKELEEVKVYANLPLNACVSCEYFKVNKHTVDCLKRVEVEKVHGDNINRWLSNPYSVNNCSFYKHTPAKFRATAVLKEGTEDDIVIPKNKYYPNGLTKLDIYTWYKSGKVLPYIKGKNLMVYIKTDGKVIKRNEDGPIKINNKEELESYNTGRMVEIHYEVGEETADGYKTKVIFIDIDPNEKVPFEKVKQITKEIADLLHHIQNVKDVTINFSGGRGFHVYGKLNELFDIDAAREMLNDTLKEYIERKQDNTLSVKVTKNPYSIRLDTSLLKKRGTLRAPYSLNSKTGLVCTPISLNRLSKVKLEDFTINKLRRKAILIVAEDVKDEEIKKVNFKELLKKAKEVAMKVDEEAFEEETSTETPVAQAGNIEIIQDTITDILRQEIGDEELVETEEGIKNTSQLKAELLEHSVDSILSVYNSFLNFLLSLKEKFVDEFKKMSPEKITPTFLASKLFLILNEAEKQLSVSSHVSVKYVKSKVKQLRNYLLRTKHSYSAILKAILNFIGYIYSKIAQISSSSFARMRNLYIESFLITAAKKLKEYEEKREFNQTPEPKPDVGVEVNGKGVIQLHEAKKAGKHYDWRIGREGVLESFVTRKLPTKKGEKVLAIQTEPHPASYISFEGEIPEGYGAGKVNIYDKASVKVKEWNDDKIKFIWDGRNINGEFTLIKQGDNKWLMIRTAFLTEENIKVNNLFY